MATQAEPSKEVKPLVKVTLFFKKRPELSEEEFHRYWSEDHAPLIASIKIFKERIVKYNQYHNDLALRNKAVSLGLEVIDFDGAAELWVTDLEALLDLMKDPEYLEKIVPDEEKFAIRGGSQFMFGYDDLKLDKTS